MNLARFARWAVEMNVFDDSVWSDHWDGGDVQDMAVECGILVETTYDPEVHGPSDMANPGDRWYVFSPEFEEAIEADDGGSEK